MNRACRAFPTLALILLGSAALPGCGLLPDSAPEGYTIVRFASSHRPVNLMEAFAPLSTQLDGGIYLYAQRDASPSLGGSLRFTQPAAAPTFSTTELTFPNGPYRFFAFGYPSTNLGGTLYCGTANSGNPIHLDGGVKVISLTLDDDWCGSSPFATGSYSNGTQPRQIEIHNCDSSEFAAVTGGDCAGTGQTVANIQSIRFGFPLYTSSDSSINELGGQPAPDLYNSSCVSVSTRLTTKKTAPVTIPYGDSAAFGGANVPPRIYTRMAFYAGTANCDVAPSLFFEFPFGIENLASAKKLNAAKVVVGTGASVAKKTLGPPPKLYLLN